MIGRNQFGDPRNNAYIDKKLEDRNIKRIDEYINDKTKILFRCILHNHTFSATPNNILSGRDCIFCKYEKMAKTKIQKCANIFYEKVKLLSVEILEPYKKAKTLIAIKCKKCKHIWKITPDNLLRGKGCPNCVHQISIPEKIWLGKMNVPDTPNNRQKYIKFDKRTYRVDGIDYNTNTIYEFLGDYYHGNPKKYKAKEYNAKVKQTFGYLRKKIKEKFNNLLKMGYNICYIWEDDYKQMKPEKYISSFSICKNL